MPDEPEQKLRIAPKDATRAPDAYEARYMPGGGGIIHREKIKASGAYHALILLPVLIVLGSAIGTGEYLPLAFSLPVLLLLWILFAVLRVTVSGRELHVQYGVFGPRIPIDAIDECRAVDYDWKAYGGWGIRRGKDGSWAYNMLGDHGRAVRMVWHDERGKERVHLVACRDPERIAAAVAEARGASARPLARIAERTAGDLAIEAEAEAEAEASAQHERRKRDR